MVIIFGFLALIVGWFLFSIKFAAIEKHERDMTRKECVMNRIAAVLLVLIIFMGLPAMGAGTRAANSRYGTETVVEEKSLLPFPNSGVFLRETVESEYQTVVGYEFRAKGEDVVTELSSSNVEIIRERRDDVVLQLCKKTSEIGWLTTGDEWSYYKIRIPTNGWAM